MESVLRLISAPNISVLIRDLNNQGITKEDIVDIIDRDGKLFAIIQEYIEDEH